VKWALWVEKKKVSISTKTPKYRVLSVEGIKLYGSCAESEKEKRRARYNKYESKTNPQTKGLSSKYNGLFLCRLIF